MMRKFKVPLFVDLNLTDEVKDTRKRKMEA